MKKAVLTTCLFATIIATCSIHYAQQTQDRSSATKLVTNDISGAVFEETGEDVTTSEEPGFGGVNDEAAFSVEEGNVSFQEGAGLKTADMLKNRHWGYVYGKVTYHPGRTQHLTKSELEKRIMRILQQYKLYRKPTCVF